MATAKAKRPAKPTVFLSHSSANRRELLALKRLLDERSGGSIDFFLSSDDDSIPHGTIWDAEVKEALDRMSLMLIFVSPEALKSGWTYFEAGYGLHKLGQANIYCLPGTERAKLPSPFDRIQNRNLHSARELGLLVRQINEHLELRLNEGVTKDDYDRIFKKPTLGIVQTGPGFEELVECVTVKALGPPDSINAFSRRCRALGLPVSTVSTDVWDDFEKRCSTGVRLDVEIIECEKLEPEFEITESIRKTGVGRIRVNGDRWGKPGAFLYGAIEMHAIEEIEAYNAKIKVENEELQRENAKRMAAPRVCEFKLSPIKVALPITIVDHWLDEVGIMQAVVAKIQLLPTVGCERRVEAVSAKIHKASLSLRDDGTLLWAERIILQLCSGENRTLTLTAMDTAVTKLSQFQIPELVSTLFELNILSLPSQRGSKRK